MKTYLIDKINRLNRISENLEAKTILCNKSWYIFNDNGNKEIYIFQDNNNLITSVNGNVQNGNWQYISANKSIIISFKNESYMYHPLFFDNTVLVLQQDGTDRYAFMIDENQIQSFHPKSLTELNSYFEYTDRKRIELETKNTINQCENEELEICSQNPKEKDFFSDIKNHVILHIIAIVIAFFVSSYSYFNGNSNSELLFVILFLVYGFTVMGLYIIISYMK